MKSMTRRLVLAIAAIVAVGPLSSAEKDAVKSDVSTGLRPFFERFDADRGNLNRFYNIPLSAGDHKRRLAFYQEQQDALKKLDFDGLSRDGQVDYLLLRNELRDTHRKILRERELDQEVLPLLPFWKPIVAQLESHRRLEPVDGKTVAARLEEIEAQIAAARGTLERSLSESRKRWAREKAERASRRVRDLSGALSRWFQFYNGYNPLFSWWVKKPAQQVREDLDRYAKLISDQLVNHSSKKSRDPDRLVGEPIGAEALSLALEREMIAYTPAELVEIAQREFAWCDKEMAKASRALGFGNDWRKAQDQVKKLHVKPGEQPKLIKMLALEAENFLEERKLLTIPPLCKETWRMQMMSASRQRVNPYFTGGEVISVSFPTDEMAHKDKLMSMRGNNIHFSRATVHHELIPGHHLQGFMTARYRPYRKRFRTPFWTEGWALYWEMLLWDLDFPKTPEDRIGMLFWRKHRCARIIFSLGFHLGTMKADEAVDFLVERVGHERRNATAEVRRSIQGGYSPLYQAAYMLGALQLRALASKLVAGGRMTPRQFHDAVLRQNSIPIEMLRAALDKDVKLTRDYVPGWKFAKDGASR
jgi:uncharacterized protein (DUF885 family)